MDTVLASRNDLNKIEILKRYRFFHDANPLLKNEILSHSNTVTLRPDAVFFQRGDQVNQLALIGAGSVRVFIVSQCGREITLYHVKSGGTCPINILSILLNRETPAIAVVEATLTAVVIDAIHFSHWVSDHAVVRQFVFDAVASRMVDVLSLLEDFKFRKLEKRLADYLLRQLPESATKPPVINATHMQLASELGSAREVISRLLRGFERMGVVDLARGKIFVNSRQALRQIIEA